MSLTTDTMSAADLKAITGNDDGILGGGFGALIILVILIGMMNGNWGGFGGGFGGFGAFGAGMADGWNLYPWLNNSQNINNGFRDQMLQSSVQGIQNSITSGFGDVQLGIAGVNQNLCNGFNSVNQSINGAQNAVTAQLYNNEIASLNRSFAEQTANTQGFSNVQSQLAQCCCDNRLATCQTQNIVQNEGNATRFADANNTRDIIDSQTRGTQVILDKLCQLELDNVKTQLDAKNDRIVDLQNQLNMAAMRESQTAQNAFIAQGLNNEVDQLYNRLSNCPVPSTPVYGRTPIFTCNSNNGGCGCGCGVA